MTHALVTLDIRFAGDRADPVEAALRHHGPRVRKGGDLRNALRGAGIHFMSMTVVRDGADRPAHLVVELSADGTVADALRILSETVGTALTEILAVAGLSPGASLPAFLDRHRLRLGQGLLDTPGLEFRGTPDLTLPRILQESALAQKVRDILDARLPRGPALRGLRDIRGAIEADPELRPLLRPEPLSPLPADSGNAASLGFIAGLVLRGALKFLWPLLLPLLAAVVAITWMAASWGTAAAILGFVLALITALLLLAALLALLYHAFSRIEEANEPDDSPPDRVTLEQVIAQEDDGQQNHLAGVSVMQAGWVRRLTLRLAFWVIGQLATYRFRPGFLGELGTIHFARWVLLPGTDKLLFFSNYGGSWESYLEDFITKASNGLTGVWSNTVGFPRTRNLFQQGAADGARFKRWARRQQRPTPFWYSAYPNLTTARLRTNAALRQGLASAATEDEAEAWFSLIGSAPRPESGIEVGEVQTLFFGGLKHHRHASCLVLELPADGAAARAWLRDLLPRLTFGDQPPPDEALVLSLGPGGLRRLGLPAATLAQFPAAFLLGMAHPSRSGRLADTGEDAPAKWLWGGQGPGNDAVLQVYSNGEPRLAASVATLASDLQRRGGRVLHRVTLADPSLHQPANSQFSREPFGFADGISQPLVRGTRRWQGRGDRLHEVEPGEILLGYPDNRGYLPQALTLPAAADPDGILTVAGATHSRGRLQPNFSRSGADAPRDFGRNGSFLVIRQLEQDVPGFEDFLRVAAARLDADSAAPPQLTQAQREQWIGAKMIGRWADGTSLIRHPHEPGSGWEGERRSRPDNDFLSGSEDPLGLRCPYGAHIRRSNPRDSFTPGSQEQLEIVNRHRILRRGRRFDAAGSGDPKARNPGLLFLCLNADIERQFEFIQQTWTMAIQFHGLANEADPLLSRGRKTGRLTIPTPQGPIMLTGLPDFIAMRGGGYFFMASRRALQWLASLPDRFEGSPTPA